jgi:hypothetical protein
METGAREYAQEENIPLEVFGVERETDMERQIIDRNRHWLFSRRRIARYYTC